MPESDNNSNDIDLAQRAARGDKPAQQIINEKIHPVIDYQTNRFCKRFCRENQFQFHCSLSKPIGSRSADAPLCEWGNASYGWMLDDLCKADRLNKFEGRNQARLFDYLYSIANSLPFYERWKDWRFGRKQSVPQYIRDLGEQAAKIFYALRSNQALENIASSVSMSLADVEDIASDIVLQLTQRHKLYLLNPEQVSSLSHGDACEETSHQQDIAVYDATPEAQQAEEHLQLAWGQLDAVEQFVLEALIIEEQDAGDVLNALKLLDVSIKEGVTADQTNRQQLYYFKRKALARLGDGIAQ